ncbi:hypothetical protein V1478_013827 [Vespula squamosa]|uniref:Uncharacterized protein n=1 Tax=Vespula squamosa TaxID=30214 RepID=A0ABD2A703_VESSQ
MLSKNFPPLRKPLGNTRLPVRPPTHISTNAYLLFKLHGKFGTSGLEQFMDAPHFVACHGRRPAPLVAVILTEYRNTIHQKHHVQYVAGKYSRYNIAIINKLCAQTEENVGQPARNGMLSRKLRYRVPPNSPECPSFTKAAGQLMNVLRDRCSTFH